ATPELWITSTNLLPRIEGLYPNLLVWDECIEEIMKITTLMDSAEEDDELPFYLGFTSGSTGSPKAFIRSHLSWIESFNCTRLEFGIEENDHVLIPGPLLHS